MACHMAVMKIFLIWFWFDYSWKKNCLSICKSESIKLFWNSQEKIFKQKLLTKHTNMQNNLKYVATTQWTDYTMSLGGRKWERERVGITSVMF